MSSEKPDQIQASVAAALSRLRGDLGPSGAAAPKIEEQPGAERPRPANDVRGDPFFRSIQSPPLGAGMTGPGRAPIPMMPRQQAAQEPVPEPPTEAPMTEPSGPSAFEDPSVVEETASIIEMPEMPEEAASPTLAAVPQPHAGTVEASQPAVQSMASPVAAPQPQTSGSNSPLSRVMRGAASPTGANPAQRDLLADLPPPPISEPLTTETETSATRRRRRNRRLLALAGIIVVAAIGAWLWTGGAPSTEVPVVAADATPEKVKPVDEGGLQVQNQNVQVLDPSTQTQSETVMPEPEQPITPPTPATPTDTAGVQQVPLVVENGAASPGATAAAPAGDAAPAPGVPLVDTPLPALEEEGTATAPESAPAAPTVAAPDPTQAAEAPKAAEPADPASAENGGQTESAQAAAAPAPAPTPAPAAEPAQTAQSEAAAPEATAPEAAAPEAPGAPAAVAPMADAPAAETPAAQPATTQEAAATPSVPVGNTRVQLAAGKSEASVEREWAALQKAHPQLLGDLGLTVERADKGAAGIFYRLQAGPLADKAAARELCASLKQRGQDCIVVTK